MQSWQVVVVLLGCLALAVPLVVLLARDEVVGDYVYAGLGVLEVALLVQLVGGSIALAGTERDVSGVLFVSYLVGVAVALPIGAFWSLAERSRAGTAVLLLAVLTVVGLQLRLAAIWGGAGA